MAPRLLPGYRVHALPAWLLLLLLRVLATLGATCPTPTSVEHADIQVKSYNLHSRERYVCNSGFKRKAGTSSLTECVFNKTTNITHWTTPNLKCIRHPSLPHQKPVPPSAVVTARVTPEPEGPSPSGKGARQHSSREGIIAGSTSAVIIVVCVVALLVASYCRSRSASQLRAVEVVTAEAIPMTGGTSSREEDTISYPPSL
ncbi:interleukin-15 receptor subunit alpha isoform X5 [Octodon degus]|uniref:Interleukin-15 receptor subunit alpha n=1 Tax=Octodon degus TaxID=10160 RepID=A0A6P6ETT2_OCTDE|nr:interleukin-15 receptor subunit alpha isoform X5 [Octodon degus]